MPLSEHSYGAVRAWFAQRTGIDLGPTKHAMVESRLQRLAGTTEAGLDALLPGWLQSEDAALTARLVDALVTNETYFFREPEHFEHLARHAAAATHPLRCWSAACSSGEEVWSMAMTLAQHASQPAWRILGTDISARMVRQASRAVYPLQRLSQLPPGYLKRFALEGTAEYSGSFLLKPALRQQVQWRQLNLLTDSPGDPQQPFDVIFLRNVLIYMDDAHRRHILQRVLRHLAPGGLLMCGHAESLSLLDLPLRTVASAVYAHAGG